MKHMPDNNNKITDEAILNIFIVSYNDNKDDCSTFVTATTNALADMEKPQLLKEDQMQSEYLPKMPDYCVARANINSKAIEKCLEDAYDYMKKLQEKIGNNELRTALAKDDGFFMRLICHIAAMFGIKTTTSLKKEIKSHTAKVKELISCKHDAHQNTL